MPIKTTKNGWILETRTVGYAFNVNDSGRLEHTYWGVRLPLDTDYPAPRNLKGWVSFSGPGHLTPEEYPAYGGVNYVEPCLKLHFADGVRDSVLQFISAEVRDGEAALDIHLHDSDYPLHVVLHYRVHADYDLIERSVRVINDGKTPVTLERVLSAQWHLPALGEYRLSHVSGRWADEFQLQREPLTVGVKTLESRRLTTSHHANPWFAIDRGQADEYQGGVWFGVLEWSGNWKLLAEVTDFGSTRVSLGLNDWDFAWQLAPAETFKTPVSYAGYTPDGFGAASRTLHRFTRAEVLPHKDTIHKVLYNSWEATLFDVDVKSQSKLAEIAAALGVELFVMDDGWFHGRKDDEAGLGDWWPDTKKFPNGLKPLIDKVQALGMTFGLWVEPEMVNPDSDLYRAHPDWVIHFPTRKRTVARNQLILNFARTDVQDYILDKLDKLLAENAIAFIKWDMNRNVSEPGWPNAPGDPRELWVRYVQGLYRVWGTLRERHPDVIWQSCSGGGGRADLGILRLADQIWVSDNTEATARLAIQEGFSHIFPANTMEAWVTDADAAHVPLEFRMHVSMCGSLGIGGDLLKWTADERKIAAGCVALYKQIRHIVQFGDVYRLRSAAHAFSALMYVASDQMEGVLFAFRTHIAEPVSLPPVYLRGLQADALYEVEGITGTRSGAAWMHAGLTLQIGNMASTVRRIWKR